MAAKKKTAVAEDTIKIVDPVPEIKPVEELIGGNDKLDPKEEKLLDMILNGIIIFVLGWLGLGVALSIGGLFKLWG